MQPIVKVQAYDLMDEVILTENTPLTRIFGYGSLSNFLQFVIKLSLLSQKNDPLHTP